MCSLRVAKHVIVADDFLELAEIVAQLLAESTLMSITVDVAADGAQAVALAVAHPPALTILDIDMPVMDGIEAALAIRHALRPSACPLLVAMTGNPFNVHAHRLMSAFDHVLAKPVDIEVLIRCLADA